MYNIGIIGINGLVGNAILESINILNLKNPNNNFIFYGSIYNKITINNIDYIINKFELKELNNLNFAILAVENELSKIIYEYIFSNNLDICIIDNSSEFRLYDSVPLCIPEINLDVLQNECFLVNKTKFISNPNCVTTLMCMVIKPLLNLSSIKKMIVSTYQAASGAGYKGLQELELQNIQIINKSKLTTDFWKRQYVYNVFSHNSKINKDNLYNEEELKLINETKKILNIDCKISPTCIRVPILRSHCMSLHIEFNKELEKEDILNELFIFPGIKVLDDFDNNQFPEPIITSNKTDVYVGRIRHDIQDKTSWNFFISGDQLLKGAGYNSVQILNKLLK